MGRLNLDCTVASHGFGPPAFTVFPVVRCIFPSCIFFTHYLNHVSKKPFMSDARPPEFGIDLETLNRLMISGRGAIIPHQVGKALRHQIPLWSRTDTEQIRDLLAGLRNELRERLSEEGITLQSFEPTTASALPKRLREEASYLAALCTYYSVYVAAQEEQIQAIHEGLFWARIAEDKLQEALLYLLSAWWKMSGKKEAEVVNDYRCGVAAALDGKHLITELDLRSRLIEWLLKERELTEAKKEADTLLSIASEQLQGAAKRFHTSRALRHLGAVELRTGNHGEAIHYLQHALREAEEKTDPIHYAAILYSLADALDYLGNSTGAIELLLEMAETGKRSEREVISANAFGRIGEIYIQQNDLELAHNAFDLAERFVDKANLPNVYVNTRVRKLPLYLQSDKIQEGINLGLDLLQHFPPGQQRIRILRLLGLLYEREANLDEAEHYLKEAYKWYSEPKKMVLHAAVPLARVLLAQERDDEAFELLLLHCKTPPGTESLLKEYAEGLVLLSRIARKRQDYPRAIEWLEQASEVQSEIEHTKHEESIKKARILADVRMREHEEELAAARRAHADRDLAEQLTGLKITYGSLLAIESRLKENLDWLTPEQREHVVAALKNAISDENVVEAVEHVASEAEAILTLHGVDTDFFDALLARWPGLTKKQQQLCGMIRAGLQTSQVVQLLGISSNSVWTQRKRLRKRLGLKAEEDLVEVIMQVESLK